MINKMANRKRVGMAIMAVVLAALLLVAACAPARITGEEKTLEYGGIWPLTGAASSSLQVVLAAEQDYVRYFNEQKVIPGVDVKLLWGDTSMQMPLFFSHYERFVASGVPVMCVMEIRPLIWLEDRSARDEVVISGLGVGFQDMCYSPKWRYFQGPTLAEQFAVVADYVIADWKEERPPKLAFVGIASEWGEDPQPEGKKYAESLGFEILPSETVPYVVLDATGELLRLRDREADFVYMQTLVGSLAPVLMDAERLGLLGQMHFVGTEAGIYDVIDMTGPASEGYLCAIGFPTFAETEVPGINLIIDKQMEYHNKVWKDQVSYERGWVESAVICEAMKRAVANVGYENVDGPAIKQELDNMKDFDVYGLASITYKDKPFDHRGTTKLAVYQVRDGDLVHATDWLEPPSLVPEGLIRE